MKRFVLIALTLSLLLGVLASCNRQQSTAGGGSSDTGSGTPEPVATVNDEGYIAVNGEKTNVNVGMAYAGQPGYVAFCQAYPSYQKTEETWWEDLMAGKLDHKQYALMSKDNGFFATAVKGTADGGALSRAALKLDKPVVLPLYEGATWRICLAGTLLPGQESESHLLANRTEMDGRVCLGIDPSRDTVFVGVCISRQWAYYGFSVSSSVMAESHRYDIEYDGKELRLTVDGGAPLSLSTYRVNQEASVAVDGKTASREFIEKARAMAGQDYLAMSYVGTPSHSCTVSLESFDVETSGLFAYASGRAHALSNKTVFYLGSSVTRGHGGDTDGTSFADMISQMTGAADQKQAISGTNLAVTQGNRHSYVERFDRFDFSEKPDVLVLQLSMNDFLNGLSAGSIADGKSQKDMDASTITGAIETILAKALAKNPGIKVVVYTCPIDETVHIHAKYKSYINGTLKQLQSKWEGVLYVLDFFNGDHIPYAKYTQSDKLHPTRMGYAQLFTPAFINKIREITA